MKNLKINEKKISEMFANMCCSECHADFDENSIEILRIEEDFVIIKLTCSKCKKSFGIAFLGLGEETKYSETIKDKQIFELYEMHLPINADDVLDAHKYIKEMDSRWQKDLKDFNDL